MQNIENKICETIEYIVTNAVAKAEYDRTIQATIVECIDASIGKYKIKYQDNYCIAYSSATEYTYTKNTEVYVLIPGNDVAREKTILGAVKKLGLNFVDPNSGDNAFEHIGNNCIESKEEFKLCSYESSSTPILLYNKQTGLNKIALNLKSVNLYLKQSPSIILGGEFKTNLSQEQRFRGNYGIGFKMNFKDNATGKILTKDYVVDVNMMEGNPYDMPLFLHQYGIFNIDNKNFDSIEQIYLFVYDFPHTENGHPADIFIKNLELQGANKIAEEQLKNYSLTFITPQGVYFDEVDVQNKAATREIQTEVRIKGNIVNKNSSQLKYYWFKENMRITSKSEKYCKYGGFGWECLNHYNIVQEAANNQEAVVEWIPGLYNYFVPIDEVVAKEVKYKCVVLYNNITMEKEITIYNLKSIYDVTIESDAGTHFYYDLGTPTLTCKINNKEFLENNYEYVWAKIDNKNSFTGLSETILENKEYNDTVTAYNTLKNKVDTEQAMPQASQQQLDNYLTIIKKYDKIMRVEKNKLHKIQINTITQFAQYKCSIFYKGVYLGTAAITLVNDLKTKNGYSLVINNSAQVFKYDEQGISPCSKTLDNPYEIPPLTFDLFNNQGKKLDEEILKQCKIEWVIPLENSMISIPSIFDANKGKYDPIAKTQTYVDLSMISYLIQNRYDVTKTNNNIQLRVSYKDLILIAETNFTFAKEGDPGTNGTDMMCQIVPNGKYDTHFYPMILNGHPTFETDGDKWFKVQLWHNGNNIFEGVKNDISQEGKPVSITWGILRNKYNHSISDETDLQIDSLSGACKYLGYHKETFPVNIVYAKIEYDNLYYYVTLPIITAITNDTYKIALKRNTGFQYAVYSADGRRPQYNNRKPFELEITQQINGYQENISNINNQYKVNYSWTILGRTYDNVNKKWLYNNFLSLVRNGDGYNKNPLAFKPIDDYDGETLNNAVKCIITQNEQQIGEIHIPIHLLLNRYGHSALNMWNGNSVSIDEGGSGVILAPQIGAGRKEKDNSFTGVVMGKVKEANQNTEDIGLIGYHKGVRTIHLDAQEGYAIFGKTGPGQIILDPSADKAFIYSNNFWEKYYNDNDGKEGAMKNGLPKTNYQYNSSTHKYNGQKHLNTDDMQSENHGMLIDLTTPRILFGSGNFRLEPNGFLYAKGGGQIAGWKFNDYRLDSVDRGTSETATGKTGMSAVYDINKAGVTKKTIKYPSGNSAGWENQTKAAAFWAGDNNFFVTHDGYLRTNEAAIGSGTNPIFIGKSTDNGNYSAIFSGKKSSFSSNNNGFYLGTDGIALGSHNSNGESKFQVTNQGVLTAREGHVGNWTVTRNTIEAGNITLNSNGSMSGGNSGGGTWSIAQNGTATFNKIYASTSGQIGGWTINGTKLTGGNTTINSNGNIDCSGGNGWYIHNDGSARFGNMSISTNGSITANGGTFNNITATGGTFNSIVVSGSAKIPANTVTGVLATGNIPNLSAGKITSGTMSANRISGGTLNISTSGGGYLKAGINTTNPEVSGLTVGSSGVAMNGNGISNIGSMSVTGGISANGGTINLNDKTQVSGDLNIKGSIAIDGQKGITLTGVELSGCDFSLNIGSQVLLSTHHKFSFYNGILVGHSTSR